jgi:DNA-binding protein HU-alpha
MTKKFLVDRVVEETGVKRRDAKPVAEAVLQELGAAIARGEVLNLQPFGKAMVKSSKSLDNADVYQLRLRRNKPSD